jgi:ATP-dependent protease ClpP protease subunit
VPVCSIVDGCAASAATLMSVVAEERKIHEHSFMLIHQLSSGMWGKYEELKDDMKNSEVLMNTIKKIYENHTTVPKSKLDQILKRDLWFDAKTCLKYGLVDEIIV